MGLGCIAVVVVGHRSLVGMDIHRNCQKPRQQATSRNDMQKQIAAEKPPDDRLDLACVEVHSVCRGSASISNDPCAERSPFVSRQGDS